LRRDERVLEGQRSIEVEVEAMVVEHVGTACKSGYFTGKEL
jgi:hypothetical protein